jgi:hypothetical protein
MQLKEQNVLMLRAILQNREHWKYDKELPKIIEKMQKGKNLKKNEFSKIHWLFWNIGH